MMKLKKKNGLTISVVYSPLRRKSQFQEKKKNFIIKKFVCETKNYNFFWACWNKFSKHPFQLHYSEYVRTQRSTSARYRIKLCFVPDWCYWADTMCIWFSFGGARKNRLAPFPRSFSTANEKFRSHLAFVELWLPSAPATSTPLDKLGRHTITDAFF